MYIVAIYVRTYNSYVCMYTSIRMDIRYSINLIWASLHSYREMYQLVTFLISLPLSVPIMMSLYSSYSYLLWKIPIEWCNTLIALITSCNNLTMTDIVLLYTYYKAVSLYVATQASFCNLQNINLDGIAQHEYDWACEIGHICII